MPDKKMDYKRRHQANIKGETKRNIRLILTITTVMDWRPCR
jgi:hypothetical protein